MPGWDELQPPVAAPAPDTARRTTRDAAPQRTASAPPERIADEAPDIPALPSPSLPKGGGAVQGIGETYAVSAATGTLTVSIPIATSTWVPQLGVP